MNCSGVSWSPGTPMRSFTNVAGCRCRMSSTNRMPSYLLPETLDFFEGFAFGFRQAGLDKEEARHTNCGVDPERFGSAQGMVKEGESISKDEACDPEACDCNRHCRAANTIRENF